MFWLRDRETGLADPRLMRRKKRFPVRPLIMSTASVLLFCFAMRLPERAALVLTFFFGLPFGVVVTLLRQVRERIRLRSFLSNVLAHTLIYVSVLTFALAAEFNAIRLANLPSFTTSSKSLTEWAGKNYAIFALLYLSFLAVVFLITSLRALARKLGPGVMWNWVRGYYHQPRTEERVVMFLDLKGSTPLAEKLGDEKFSALIRDFFSDMTEPIHMSKATVSHYIGDEAVITWAADDMGPGRAVQCFYYFQEKLCAREAVYRQRYGVVPEFKAGLHVGPVVVTEVGDLKSEFVLHGDTLNVASRIQGLCNSYGESLIASSDLKAKLKVEEWMQVTGLGDALVKGKTKELDLYAIHLAPST